MVVKVGHAVLYVDHKENHIGLLDCKMHLLVDFFLKNVVAVHYPAASVDNRHLHAVPVHFAILAVARGAACVVDNGGTGLGQSVEEGRLAHIGPTHYCY